MEATVIDWLISFLGGSGKTSSDIIPTTCSRSESDEIEAISFIPFGEPLAEPEPDETGYTGRYRTHVSGEQYSNPDGISRQDIIKRLALGLPLRLVREKNNKYDSNAIAVYSNAGCIGYVSKKNAVWIAPLIDEGNDLFASIADIFPDNYEGDFFLNVLVNIDNVPSRKDRNPIYIIAAIIERTDEERKTWKGQRNWLIRAKNEGAKYIETQWVSEHVKEKIKKILEFIDTVISTGDEITNETNLSVVIDMDIEKTNISLNASWINRKTGEKIS